MTTATLVLLAALTLVFNPVRVLAILMLVTLLYFNPIPTVITLAVLTFLFYLLKRKS
ncbi:MAG: hypothetical protein JSU59_05325 [Nitrospirota bacterium]|nr:MAG: hypothetical protein JSU59_05325 [Nitrospirota bacterium]